MPGISPRRIFGSVRTRRARFGFGSSSPRSSFGARFRTRCPQYGHSVTYGLTSDPQFLQTTNRSGWLTTPQGTPRGGAARRLLFGHVRRLGDRGGDDLGDDLPEVVVGLV